MENGFKSKRKVKQESHQSPRSSSMPINKVISLACLG